MRKAGKVINIEEDKVYIITTNKEFVTLVKHSTEPIIGELYIGEELKNPPMLKYFLIIVCVLLLTLPARKLYLDNKYNFSVIVDMNCSLKMEVTSSNKIKKVEGISSGGFKMKEDLDLKHKTLEDALRLILDESIKQKYLTKAHADDGFKITIFVSDNKNSSPLYLTKFIEYANEHDFEVSINNGNALIK